MEDIYFELNYGRLYEKIEGGSAEVFNFDHPLGNVRHLFIKRRIPIHMEGGPFYDIITPYGYGGPLITTPNNENKNELVKAFELAFQEYCNTNKVISEFVRFHPIMENAEDFSACYNISFKRKTTGTTLKNKSDPVQEEFSKSTRKATRKAINSGVEFRVTPNPDSLDNFQKVYLDTMQRLDANKLYYFDEDYFSKCQYYFGENIVLVEALFEDNIIGAELHFHYNNILHTHLSGTLCEYHHLSPVYVMTYAIALWGKEHGVDLIHSGGGRTGDPEDPLFLFKKRFGKNTEFQYFTGTRIWNPETYERLRSYVGVDKDVITFPAYRDISAIENR